MNRESMSGLRHARQFLLTPRSIDTLHSWNSYELAPDLFLYAHGDLPVHVHEADGRRIVLAGFVVDPRHPDRDDTAILAALAGSVRGAHELPEAAADLGGRWVMIGDDGVDRVLWHDACGLREVFHTTDGSGETWCASQPTRIAQVLGLASTDEHRDFVESAYYREHHEPWWPGTVTPYREIHRLLPNHALDLRTREVRRFWPTAPLTPLDPETAAQRAAALLRGGVLAVSRRHALALPITAGYDSRCVLAATRDLEDVHHYTAHRHGLDRSAPDLRTPARLLRRLGRRHHVVACPSAMSAPFADVYEDNVFFTHASAGAIAEGLHARFPRGHLSLSGHCSEIARDTYGVTHLPEATAEMLTDLMSMRRTPFAVEHVGRWLERARPVAREHGLRVWDLFFWEQEYGVWAANGQSQWDLVHERFTPFACRPLLVAMLAADPEHRQGPDYALHRRIMEILWPEVLSEPINPATPRSLTLRIRRRWEALASDARSRLVREAWLVPPTAGVCVELGLPSWLLL